MWNRICYQAQLEWKLQIRRPFVWLCFALPFAVAFFDTLSMAWEPSGQLAINGPGILTIRSIIYSILGGLIAAGIVGEAACRNRVYGMEGSILTLGVSKTIFAIPVFFVSFAITLLAITAFVPAVILASNFPGIRPDYVVANRIDHYLGLIAIFVVPNLLLASAIAFSAGTFFRSRTAPYLGVVAMISLYVLGRMLLGVDVYRHDVFPIYALLDPFGSIASTEFVNTWSIEQQNRQIVPLAGWLLLNRTLWITISIVLVGLAIASIPNRIEQSPKLLSRCIPAFRSPRIPMFSQPSWLHMFSWECRLLFRLPGLWLVFVFAGLNLWLVASSASTHAFSLPTTDLLLHNTNYYFDKCLILVIAWSSADLIYRERQAKVDEFIDSLPSRDFTRFVSKLLAMLAIVSLFWILAIAVNISYQLSRQFYDIELRLHLFDGFLVRSPYYVWMACLAFAIQIVTRNRYIGIALFLIVYVSEVALDGLGIYNPLFRFGRTSFFFYSLMDGYGHFLPLHFLFALYWSSISIVLLTIAWCTYSRGRMPIIRRALLRKRLKKRWPVGLIISNSVTAFSIFAFLMVVNYQSKTWPPIDIEKIGSNIEKEFGELWRDKLQPKVVDVNYEVKADTVSRSLRMKGTLKLENQGTESIEQLMVMSHPQLSQMKIEIAERANLIDERRELGVQIYELKNPLKPGERFSMDFESVSQDSQSFALHAATDRFPEVSEVEVIGNGTALLNLQFIPFIGYNDRVELKPAWKRRKYGMESTWQPPNPESGKHVAHGASHLGWMESLNASLTTSSDQTILHAGKLSKSVMKDQSSHSRVTTDHKVRGWSQMVSGRYEHLDFHRDGVPSVEVYFDPQHTYCVDAIGNALLDTIEHFQKRYGKPPFETFRMAENSLHYDVLGAQGGLGYASEVIGWKTDLAITRGSNIEELAAQLVAMAWWGDQIIPANVEGAKVIHSGLPYWTAALYLYQHQSRNINRALRMQAMREMFRERGKLDDVELPFIREFKDSTMIRKKGAIQFLYFAERIGVAKLEGVLAGFLDRWRYKGPPYPTANDFLLYLRQHLPQEMGTEIDLFFRETHEWGLKVVSAKSMEIKPSMHRLTCELAVTWKHKPNDATSEYPKIPIQVVVFSGSGFEESDELLNRWMSLSPGSNTVDFELTENPTRVGIDPYLLIPDLNPSDNVIRVIQTHKETTK